MNLYLYCFLLILLSISVVGISGEMELLAVSEINDQLLGSTATLGLEITTGKGRVFIDTYPFTQLDTQISTRFAKDIACSLVEIDCSQLDFFYSIHSQAPIIGGPSAGAGIALLTIALLTNSPYDEGMSITGTINSGGVIGPVSGIKEKIDAAARSGLTTVIIPLGTRTFNDTNTSLDLVVYGEKLGLDVVELGEINDALFYFTGKVLFEKDKNFTIDPRYTTVMKQLGDELCKRSDSLTPKVVENGTEVYDIYKQGVALTQKANNASRDNQYYSRASYCFGANIHYRHASLLALNISKETSLDMFTALESSIGKLESIVNEKKLKTITDLQAHAVVNERIIESKELLNQSQIEYEANNTQYLYTLSFATERLFSAISWSNFYGSPGTEYDFSSYLEQGCHAKFAEAQERYQYATLILPGVIAESELEKIQDLIFKKNYVSCLFQASQLKAQANRIFSVLGVQSSTLNQVLETKSKIVGGIIARQIEKGSFPIVGYSYFEYAQDLQESDPQTALLYLEYALELSDLSIYFPQPKAPAPGRTIPTQFILGLLLGFMAGLSYKAFKRNR